MAKFDTEEDVVVTERPTPSASVERERRRADLVRRAQEVVRARHAGAFVLLAENDKRRP
ncbi:MAG TPA: hypothetical protein VFS43_13260 [Polyangiaceae bacterium]|nr:hypothetical protein [Polyangiaceae bacterium]